MPEETVLALSVGTQFMGLALVCGHSLDDWKVKNFEGAWSKLKLKGIVNFVERYLKAHSIDRMVLKVPEPCRSSPAVESLTEALRWLCQEETIPVKTCTISDLKTAYNVKNKAELMSLVIAEFPELSYMQRRAQGNTRVYHDKMFEAVLSTRI